jgi:hypothetical protein
MRGVVLRADSNGSRRRLSMMGELAAKPVFDANGEFRGYRGTGTDVTAITRAQEEPRNKLMNVLYGSREWPRPCASRKAPTMH